MESVRLNKKWINYLSQIDCSVLV